MKIPVCIINMNEGDGRQMIYWDTEDKLLHSEVEPEADTEYRCETLEEANETAFALWGRDSLWGFEWI